MSTPLKISPRLAGQVEIAKFCPRCLWYELRLKRFPFGGIMPGVMFYLERTQKAFIKAFLAEHGQLPKYLGPFAGCTEPVEFPFRMSALHEDTGVQLTAQVDMMLRNADDTICLLDLKTSKFDGGGAVFHPQYEIQVTGYSWVTEQSGLGDVGKAGLIFCEIQTELFEEDPLGYETESGILVPFNFRAVEVELDYSRLTRCIKQVLKVWDDDHPPKGTEGCKDCGLLTRLFDFEDELRGRDALNAALFPRLRDAVFTQQYYRALSRNIPQWLHDAIQEDFLWDQPGDVSEDLDLHDSDQPNTVTT